MAESLNHSLEGGFSMNVIGRSLTSLAVLLVGAAICAQHPTPTPTPGPALAPTPPAPPGAPGWDGFYYQFASTQSKASKLAEKYVKEEKSEVKQEIRKQLTDVLNQHFDNRMEEQKKELDKLEKEIADLRAVLKKRQDAKGAIVERRIETLIQEAEGLGWNAPGRRGPDFGFDFNIPGLMHPAPTPPALPKPPTNR
jgi:hypothetical protein